MRRVTENEESTVLKYLQDHVSECIYLCIDLQKYGTKNPDALFWCSWENDEPDTVAMKYYDSFQIFSANEKWDTVSTAELIKEHPVMTISGKASMIEELSGLLPEYTAAYGVIVEEADYREFRQFETIREAVPEDAMEIARLMCTDQEFGDNYEIETLARQLADRMREKAGRSYVMWEDGKIVAHTAIFAENGEIAVESGLIVDAAYQSKFYGMIIHEYVKKQLAQEGKKLYGFRINDRMKRCTKAVDSDPVCGHYGKLTRRKENEG